MYGLSKARTVVATLQLVAVALVPAGQGTVSTRLCSAPAGPMPDGPASPVLALMSWGPAVSVPPPDVSRGPASAVPPLPPEPPVPLPPVEAPPVAAPPVLAPPVLAPPVP